MRLPGRNFRQAQPGFSVRKPSGWPPAKAFGRSQAVSSVRLPVPPFTPPCGKFVRRRPAAGRASWIERTWTLSSRCIPFAYGPEIHATQDVSCSCRTTQFHARSRTALCDPSRRLLFKSKRGKKNSDYAFSTEPGSKSPLRPPAQTGFTRGFCSWCGLRNLRGTNICSAEFVPVGASFPDLRVLHSHSVRSPRGVKASALPPGFCSVSEDKP